MFPCAVVITERLYTSTPWLMIHTQVTATPLSPHALVWKQRSLCAPASSYVIAPHIPLSRRVVNKGRHVVQWSTCRRSRGREQSWLLFPFFMESCPQGSYDYASFLNQYVLLPFREKVIYVHTPNPRVCRHKENSLMKLWKLFAFRLLSLDPIESASHAVYRPHSYFRNKKIST